MMRRHTPRLGGGLCPPDSTRVRVALRCPHQQRKRIARRFGGLSIADRGPAFIFVAPTFMVGRETGGLGTLTSTRRFIHKQLLVDAVTPIGAFAAVSSARPGPAMLFESAPGAGVGARRSLIALG